MVYESSIQRNQRCKDKYYRISPHKIQLQPRVLMSGNHLFSCHVIIKMVSVSLGMHLNVDKCKKVTTENSSATPRS